MGVSTTSAAVGRAIRSKRNQANLSLERVARWSDLSATELHGIESGRSRPSIAVLDRIARALGTTLADLVAGASDGHGLDGAGQTARERLGLADIAWAVVKLPLPHNGGSKLDAIEAATVLIALRTCNENQSAAARLLGMERKAFVRRLSHARRSGVKLDLAASGPRAG